MEAGNALLEGAAKPDMKKLKEKSREMSAARKELDKHLKEEFVAFQETVLPQLEGIKALKQARLNTIKQSPEYKAFNSKKMSFSQLFAKFQKKYPTIPRSCVRNKVGRICFCYRYNSSLMMMQRKFRLRKWYN
jgi:AAA15 family ATPase/GTPase